MAPETTWGLALSHQGDVWRGKISLNGSGGYWFDPGNTVRQQSFMIADAEVSRKFGDGELTLWVKNLFDEEYVGECNNASRCYYGAERTVQGTVSYNW